MLLKIMLIRLLPLLPLSFCRERKKLKVTYLSIFCLCSALFAVAAGTVLKEKGIVGIFYLLAALLPHSICYLFAGWLLFRCIWKEWSLRVWKRILRISVLIVVCGVLTETYWNPWLLRFFQ